MRTIGITGGVGSGKSEILNYLKTKYNAHIIEADKIGHVLIEKDNICYPAIVELLGKDILKEDGSIDRSIMASKIFDNEMLRKKVNFIIHPAVRSCIIDDINVSFDAGFKTVVVEAALLVEEDYGEFLDEIWYIYASEQTRTKRLKEARGYSDEKIRSIMDSQCTEEEFKNYCDIMIDNDGSTEDTFAQIDLLMK